MKLPLDASILICAHNEEKNIPSLLVSLANQTAIENISEVLIADNASTDKTIQVAKQIAETYDLPVHIFSLASNNLGYSRQFLVEQAKSDFIVFVDADCKVESNWLQALISHFSNFSKHNSRLAGVGGPNRLPEKNLFQKMINQNLDQGLLHGFSAQGVKSSRKNGSNKDHLPTTNALFLKSAVLKVGNFSEKFSRVGEDLDLGLRLKKQGYQLLLFPSPVVTNDSCENLMGWLKRMFGFGVAQGLTAGRRISFVTLSILTTSIILPSLPFLTFNQLAYLTAAWLLFAVLCCRVVRLPKARLSGFAKGIWGHLLGMVTLTFTVLVYTAGFYKGLLNKLLQLISHGNSRPATSRLK